MTGLRPSFGREDVARRSAGGYGRPPDPPGLAHRKETERIARALDERARSRARRRAREAPATGPDAAGVQGPARRRTAGPRPAPGRRG